jgi:hypothetical protein
MKSAAGIECGGYRLKRVVVGELITLGHDVIDCGAGACVAAQLSADPRFQRRQAKVLRITKEQAQQERE